MGEEEEKSIGLPSGMNEGSNEEEEENEGSAGAGG